MLISTSINVQTQNGIAMYFKIAHKIDILGRLFRWAHQAAWTMPTICDAGRCYFFFIAFFMFPVFLFLSSFLPSFVPFFFSSNCPSSFSLLLSSFFPFCLFLYVSLLLLSSFISPCLPFCSGCFDSVAEFHLSPR